MVPLPGRIRGHQFAQQCTRPLGSLHRQTPQRLIHPSQTTTFLLVRVLVLLMISSAPVYHLLSLSILFEGIRQFCNYTYTELI